VRAKTRRQTITPDDLAHYPTQVILQLRDEIEIAPTRVIYALAGGELRHGQNCGFSPSLLGQKAWLEEDTGEYRGGGAIGGTKYGGDTGYWQQMTHFMNL
jgi:hypothetical protein